MVGCQPASLVNQPTVDEIEYKFLEPSDSVYTSHLSQLRCIDLFSEYSMERTYKTNKVATRTRHGKHIDSTNLHNVWSQDE